MFRNSLLVGFRNLIRQKSYALLNIFGLASALAIFLLIIIYISHETSYDKFYPDADRIFRIDQTYIWGDSFDKFGSTGPAVADAVRSSVPGVETICRIMTPSSPLLTLEQAGQKVSFEELGVLAADSSFFDLFGFDLIAGNPKSALAQPNGMVMTRSAALKYFGEVNVLGRSIEMLNGEVTRNYLVSGVMEDPPSNMHFTFNILVSLQSFEQVERLSWSWIWTGFATYLKLQPGSDLAAVKKQMLDLPAQHAEASLMRVYGQTFEEYTSQGKSWNLYLSPISDIWLFTSDIPNRLGALGDIQYIYLFAIVGLLILILACVNYTNLATARYAGRLREVGVRKSLGANQRDLFFQFLVEAFLLSMASIVLAVGLVEVMLPYFNYLFELDLIFELGSAFTIGVLVGLLCITTLLSGFYPSVFIAKTNTIRALKGNLKTRERRFSLRNSLVFVQFVISISLIIFTTLVYQQLQFLQQKKLGFNKDNLIVISQTQRLEAGQATFLEQIKLHSAVENASISDATPPYIWNADHFSASDGDREELPINYAVADENYLKLLEVPLLQGRYFSEAFGAETNNVIINRKAATMLGWDIDAATLQKKLLYNGGETRFNVIGIMDDFNFHSLQENVEPFVLFTFGAPIYARDVNYISLRLNSQLPYGQVEEVMADVEEAWLSVAPGLPFRYRFTDQAYFESFKAEQRLGELLKFFAILAIIIATMGLFGISSYTAQRRSKELGIRKVLGASMQQLVYILNRDYLILALLAAMVSIPTIFVLGGSWLENFPYRTSIGWEIICLAVFSSITIALAAVVFQSIKAASQNPADVLHDE